MSISIFNSLLLNQLRVDLYQVYNQEYEGFFSAPLSAKTIYDEIRSFIESLSIKNKEIAAPLTTSIIKLIDNALRGFDGDVVGATFSIVAKSSHITSSNIAQGWHIDADEYDKPDPLEECSPKAIIFTLKGSVTEFLQIPFAKRKEFFSLNRYYKKLVGDREIAYETLLKQL
jgi:hypothetical protein